MFADNDTDLGNNSVLGAASDGSGGSPLLAQNQSAARVETLPSGVDSYLLARRDTASLSQLQTDVGGFTGLDWGLWMSDAAGSALIVALLRGVLDMDGMAKNSSRG